MQLRISAVVFCGVGEWWLLLIYRREEANQMKWSREWSNHIHYYPHGWVSTQWMKSSHVSKSESPRCLCATWTIQRQIKRSPSLFHSAKTHIPTAESMILCQVMVWYVWCMEYYVYDHTKASYFLPLATDTWHKLTPQNHNPPHHFASSFILASHYCNYIVK